MTKEKLKEAYDLNACIDNLKEVRDSLNKDDHSIYRIYYLGLTCITPDIKSELRDLIVAFLDEKIETVSSEFEKLQGVTKYGPCKDC